MRVPRIYRLRHYVIDEPDGVGCRPGNGLDESLRPYCGARSAARAVRGSRGTG